MESKNDSRAACMPAAEGVRFDFGDASACAVRNEARDIAVRVQRRGGAARAAVERIPLVRGAARLFFGIADFFASLQSAARLDPQRTVRGGRGLRRFAELFSTTPQAMVALGVGIAVPAILLALMVGLPAAAEALLLQIDGIPRFAVNTICCALRMAGAVLGVVFGM